MNTLTRKARTPRRAEAAAAILSVALVLSACGGNGDDEGTEENGNDTAETNADDHGDAESSSKYPVTVDTAYGELTLEEEPERVLVLTPRYVDFLATLDVTPVATGDTAAANLVETYPWLESLETGEVDEGLTSAEDGAQPEAIAAHEPDLILMGGWQTDEETYELLNQIAPTYAGGEDQWDWDAELEVIGTLLGREDEAQEAITETEELLEEARESLPEFQGASVNLVQFWEQSELRFPGATAWLEDLGMVPAENQVDGDSVSLENIEELEADVLVVFLVDEADQAVLEDDPRFQNLPAVQNDALLYIDHTLARATTWTDGPHSLDWALDEVLPELESSEFNSE